MDKPPSERTTKALLEAPHNSLRGLSVGSGREPNKANNETYLDVFVSFEVRSQVL